MRFDDLCHLLESLGFGEAGAQQSSLVPKGWRGGEDQPAEHRLPGKTVPGQTGPGYNLETQAGRQSMIKYEVIIYWSEQDAAFIAEVPELPGCAAHGPTQEDALSNALDAIRLWIDTAKEFGDPIPEPKGRRLILA
ncbi:MAG TPA: type II toxin-antitoxin system HicB family antitoxin [Bryobacteraceae bacterium]|nr:type II toxin-antitoxin system HicB family antitoxin [Bryobacteraceae bacterium]